MKNAQPDLAVARADWTDVPVLVPQDDPCLDPAPIARLFAERGEKAAEHVIGRAMDQLTDRIALTETQHAACQFADLARTARSIVGLAEELGFRGVARAAANVSTCAMLRDPCALAATVARLVRLADQSLSAVWDIDQDISPPPL